MFGPQEADRQDKDQQFRFFNPTDDAKMKGILQKVSKEGYETKIRVISLAPKGEFLKPNIGVAVGAFKQFNTNNLNSFKPDGATKTNAPNYFLKQYRRQVRERNILLLFQWRDFFELDSGYMMNAEEIATIWHLPSKYLRSPGVQRATSGLSSAPENVPYA